MLFWKVLQKVPCYSYKYGAKYYWLVKPIYILKWLIYTLILGVYFSINIRQGWLPPDSGVEVWERWKNTYFIFLYLSWCLTFLPWASISDLAAAAAAVLLLWKIKEKLNKHMKTSTVTLSVWHLMAWTSVSLPEIISDNCFSNYSLDIPTCWVLHHKQHEWKTFLCKGVAHGITGYW